MLDSSFICWTKVYKDLSVRCVVSGSYGHSCTLNSQYNTWVNVLIYLHDRLYLNCNPQTSVSFVWYIRRRWESAVQQSHKYSLMRVIPVIHYKVNAPVFQHVEIFVSVLVYFSCAALAALDLTLPKKEVEKKQQQLLCVNVLKSPKKSSSLQHLLLSLQI